MTGGGTQTQFYTQLIYKATLSLALKFEYTAIPYRASTGPEQGFLCEVFLTGKNLFSLQGTPFLIAGTLFSLQGFPCEKNVFNTGKRFAVHLIRKGQY